MAIILTDTVKSVEDKIAKATAKVLNARVKKNKKSVTDKLFRSIPNWVVSQPEIESMLKEGVPGSLNAQFGLLPGQAVKFVDELTKAIIDATEVIVTPFGTNFTGSVAFNFQPVDFANLLKMNSTYLNLKNNIQVNWLEWLLKRGDSIIVVGYHYFPNVGNGRSGGGTMQQGLAWRVPPEFSGTSKDNFVTRLFSGREKVITALLPLLLKA